MPYPMRTKITVSHVWDDESKTDYKISIRKTDDEGRCIDVSVGGDVITFYSDSWESIKKTIDELFNE